MFDPTEMVTDALHGPRAEVVVALRGRSPTGLARSIAILAAAPAVEGLILEPDALDRSRDRRCGSRRPFTAFLLGRSDIDDVPLTAPLPLRHSAVGHPDYGDRGGVGATQGCRRRCGTRGSRTASTFSTSPGLQRDWLRRVTDARQPSRLVKNRRIFERRTFGEI